jgi:tRNA threonylcarbamoyladenosine biosynthesis protein TsaE
MKLVVKNLRKLDKFAEKVADSIGKTKKSGATVIALFGDLGAGKTAFTKSLAKSLGISNMVSSPTFVIEKIYSLKNSYFKKLIHIDAYRIDHPRELAVLGFENLLKDPTNLIVVEWADRVKPLVPKDAFKIFLSSAENSEHRHLTYHAPR